MHLCRIYVWLSDLIRTFKTQQGPCYVLYMLYSLAINVKTVNVLGVKKKLLLFFIFNNFLLHSWMIIKFWQYIAEECTILWVWLCSINLFHCSVIMHSFWKIVSDFATFHQLCTFLNPHRVCTGVSRTKGAFIQIWDIFCGACSQWEN